MKVVVINPTYNEKENIGLLIEEEQKVFKKIHDHQMHTLVVDDSSPDETHKIVQEKMKTYKNLHLVIGGKQGLGMAYIRGMDYAINQLDADVFLEMDADFSHDPEKIPEFLEKIDQGYDFVIGSRYIKGGSIPANWGIHRKIFSVLGNFLVRFILGRFKIHDWTGGYRAVRKEFFQKTHERLYGFAGYTFQVGFLYYSLMEGAKVAEVPINFVDRKYGKSKIAPLHYIATLLLYVTRMRIRELWSRFAKFLAVGGVGFIINAATLRILVENFRWAPAPANLVGAGLAIFSNFNGNNLWTFREQKITSPMMYVRKLLEFYATSAFGVIIIQTGTIWLGDHSISRKFYPLYFLIGTGLLLVWNFTMYNVVIWRKKHVEKT